MYTKEAAYKMGIKNEEKDNSLDLHLYKEDEGWKHLNKKASESAEFIQLKKAMDELAKQAKKAGYKFRINVWHEGTLKTAMICKEWSM